MTEKDAEIQLLGRENQKLRIEVEALKNVHQLDMAEVICLRRQVGFLMESEHGEE